MRTDLAAQETNSFDETPARAITKLALSRQVDVLNTSERPPARRQGRALTRRDATRLKANAAGYSGDSEADMLPGIPESAGCVQGSIDSRNSAIHNAYRISLRPSSLFEPRHPSLKVVMVDVAPKGY